MPLRQAGVKLEVQGLSQFNAALASATRSVDNFSNAGSSINRGLSSTNRSFSDAQRNASTFGRTIADQSNIASRGFGSFASSVVSGAGLITGALVPLAGGLALGGLATSIVDTRITFERELANVGALARATDSEIAQLSATAEALGSSTAFSATQILEAAQFTTLSGFTIDETITALPGLLDAASASQTSLAQTSDILTDALSGFQLGVEETSRVSDTLIATTTSSNTNLVDLSQALSFVAPEAARVGESVEEASAALGILADAGIRATRGGTGLRRIYSNLITPIDDAGVALQELGIQTFDQQGNFLGLANVLEQFETQLDGVSQQGREDVLSRIFDTNALTAFSVLLPAGSDELRSFTEELENSAGTAEQAAGRQLNSLAGDITILSSATEGLSLALTRSLTPALRSTVRGVTSFVTGTTGFVEGLNEGGLTLRGFSIALQDIAPNVSFALGALSDIEEAALGLSNINLNLDGLFGFDTLRVFRFEDLFSFEVGDLSGVIRGAFDEVSIDLGDLVSFDFTRGESLSFNIADFITFDSTDALTQLDIGDFISFTSEDIGSLFSDATANITRLTIGDLIDFTGTTGPAGTTINVNDVIVGTYDLANNITTVSITDLVTGTLDLTTGQGSVTLGEDLTFEFDISGLQTAINSALAGEFTFDVPDIQTGLQTAIDTALGGLALTFAVPALAAQTFDIEIPAPLLNFTVPSIETETFEIEIPAPALNFLAPVLGDATTVDIPVPTALTDFDFGSLFGNLESLGGVLSGLDEGLAGATGDDSALAGFVDLVNTQIGGLATALDSVDSETIGQSLTSVITSITSIFTQLNTIDDLALGGIAGSLSDLTTSILGFATGVTEGLDADAIGEAAASSAATFISSFQAVFAEPDLPEIGLAASGLVAGLGEQFRTAFEPGNFTVVGASLGQLTTTIIDQIAATLSDPEIGTQLGAGFADIIVGLTQGLSDVLAGFAAETEGVQGELTSASQTFVANLISALAAGLADADYGSVALALVQGIGRSLLGGSDENREVVAQTFEGAELPTGVSLVPRSLSGVADSFATALGFGTVSPAPVDEELAREAARSGGTGGFGGVTSTIDLLAQSATEAAQPLNELAAAQSAVAESAPEPGFFDGFLNFFGVGGAASPAEEARRTGLGTGVAFDEADIAGSVQDQILTQLNFGDLPETVATAATEAIGAAIPAESIVDPELITSTLTEAVSAAIPAEPVIDAETVNETLLVAAQEAIPASEIPSFPGWRQVLDFRAPRIPNFPSWRRVLNIRVPRIPNFPGWGRFINFDIPSIPAFPGWVALTGAVDLATLVPAFPGWDTLINVDVAVPSLSCEVVCGGGGGSGGGGGTTGGGGGGAEFSPFQTGTDNFPGGLALVSEAGDEAIITPQGQGFIARGEQLISPPIGSQIIPAQRTQMLLNGDTEPIETALQNAGTTPEPTTLAGRLMQSSPNITNITNNVVKNFNLTTESLRSTESVGADFAMTERLASVSGVI